MSEVMTISTLVTTICILIGLLFTIIELRQFTRTRKTEIIMEVMKNSGRRKWSKL